LITFALKEKKLGNIYVKWQRHQSGLKSWGFVSPGLKTGGVVDPKGSTDGGT